MNITLLNCIVDGIVDYLICYMIIVNYLTFIDMNLRDIVMVMIIHGNRERTQLKYCVAAHEFGK